MSKTYNENMHFAGGLSVGNFAHGTVIVSPSPAERISVDVTGLNLEGDGEIFPQVQVHTAWPWYSCSNATVGHMESVNPWDDDGTQFRIFFVRTNSAETWISWCVWKGVTA